MYGRHPRFPIDLALQTPCGHYNNLGWVLKARCTSSWIKLMHSPLEALQTERWTHTRKRMQISNPDIRSSDRIYFFPQVNTNETKRSTHSHKIGGEAWGHKHQHVITFMTCTCPCHIYWHIWGEERESHMADIFMYTDGTSRDKKKKDRLRKGKERERREGGESCCDITWATVNEGGGEREREREKEEGRRGVSMRRIITSAPTNSFPLTQPTTHCV